ncbi:MAG: hypothetical protein ACC652_06450 [Acidimicrobiales bacterium]
MVTRGRVGYRVGRSRINRQQTGWALLVGGALAVAGGLFLPWATLSAPLVGTVSVYGAEGDGQIAAVAGALAIVAGILTLNGKTGVAANLLAFFGTAGVGLVVWTDYPNITETVSDTGMGQVGTGMYALVVSVVALVVGTGTLVFQKFDDDADAATGSRKLPKGMDTDEVSRRTRELMEIGGLEWGVAWKRVVAQMDAENDEQSTEED